jgi:hypothetical protein
MVLVSVPVKAQAPNWDLTHSVYNGSFTVNNITYGLNITVSSEDFKTGFFHGIADGLDIRNGDVSGDSVRFGFGNTDYQGTITPTGMGGQMDATGPGGIFYGFWGVTGKPERISNNTPEPGSLALLLSGSLAVAGFLKRRRR